MNLQLKTHLMSIFYSMCAVLHSYCCNIFSDKNHCLPVSHRSPVWPFGHTQNSSSTQVPPFTHGLVLSQCVTETCSTYFKICHSVYEVLSPVVRLCVIQSINLTVFCIKRVHLICVMVIVKKCIRVNKLPILHLSISCLLHMHYKHPYVYYSEQCCS